VAKSKSRPDKALYDRLRSSGVRKKAAKQVSRVLPGKSSPSTKAAERIANDLNKAASDIKDLISRGPQKRSAAAKKGAKTRKANQKKRSQSAKKGAKTRKKSGKG
jgi:hypothetical protein